VIFTEAAPGFVFDIVQATQLAGKRNINRNQRFPAIFLSIHISELGSVDDHFAAITPATRWIAAAKFPSVLS